ncbi:MAG: hypothetical protein PF542_06595 [Nanoarchaeota archaeon]|jgi:hypothetical protein|nr:hypothetical protein [Nanoarchaeota archaeon]
MKKTLLTTMLIAGLAFPAKAPENSQKQRDKYTQTLIAAEQKAIEMEKYYATTDSLNQIAPTNYISYKTQKLMDADCSQYVRRAGEDIFGLSYSWNHAEKRREAEKIKYVFKSKAYDWDGKIAELDSLVKNGEFKRGMILAFYNPRNQERKPYSHMEVGNGFDENGEFWTMGNRGTYQGKSKLSKIREEGYDLIEILTENPQFMADNTPKSTNNDI